MLPTFLVIGAKKAGSTSLFRYLRAHPEVFMPADKRLDFFSGEAWSRGVAWYEEQFAAAGAARARGEASNTYAYYPWIKDVAARAHSVVPEARLVYIVRHPVERIVSHYRQAVVEWGRTAPIGEAVLGNPGEYISPSKYALQLDQWLAHYPRRQLLVITSDELEADRHATLSRVYAFVGVDPAWRSDEVERRFNQASDYRQQPAVLQRARGSRAYRQLRDRVPKAVRHRAWRLTSRPAQHDPALLQLDDDDRERILDHLRPDLVRLRTHLGDDFHCWGLV